MQRMILRNINELIPSTPLAFKSVGRPILMRPRPRLDRRLSFFVFLHPIQK